MTTHHHAEPKPKMGKVRNPVLPLAAPKPSPEVLRPDPQTGPRPGREAQSTPFDQGARPTQNPQTAKPALYLPPSTDFLSEKGTAAAGLDTKQDEEEQTRPGMLHPKARPNLPGNVKK